MIKFTHKLSEFREMTNIVKNIKTDKRKKTDGKITKIMKIITEMLQNLTSY